MINKAFGVAQLTVYLAAQKLSAKPNSSRTTIFLSPFALHFPLFSCFFVQVLGFVVSAFPRPVRFRSQLLVKFAFCLIYGKI